MRLPKGVVTIGLAPPKVPKGLAACFISSYGAKFNIKLHVNAFETKVDPPLCTRIIQITDLSNDLNGYLSVLDAKVSGLYHIHDIPSQCVTVTDDLINLLSQLRLVIQNIFKWLQLSFRCTLEFMFDSARVITTNINASQICINLWVNLYQLLCLRHLAILYYKRLLRDQGLLFWIYHQQQHQVSTARYLAYCRVRFGLNSKQYKAALVRRQLFRSITQLVFIHSSKVFSDFELFMVLVAEFSAIGYLLQKYTGINPMWRKFGKEFSSDNAGDGPGKESKFFDFPAYDHEKFSQWKQGFMDTLASKNLYMWKRLKDKGRQPSIADGDTAESIKKYEKKNTELWSAVSYCLRNSVSGTNMKQLINITSVEELDGEAAFKALEKYHETPSNSLKIRVVRDLFNCKLGETESNFDYKARLDEQFEKFKSLKITDADYKCALFLEGIKSRYPSFVDALLLNGGALVYDELLRKLQEHEGDSNGGKSQEQEQVDNGQVAQLVEKIESLSKHVKALKATTRLSNGKKSKKVGAKPFRKGKDSSKMTEEQLNDKYPGVSAPHEKKKSCTYCKKKGHTERTCYKAHPELKPESANIAREIAFSSCSQQISDSSSIEAYVDSGASSHVVATANISVFSRVRSVITNLFGIGGTVKCTHRGTYGSMENAIHAPASNTNLFSVAPETDKGYIALFSSTGFHLFPASAVRTVGKPVRSGIRVGNLYTTIVSKYDQPLPHIDDANATSCPQSCCSTCSSTTMYSAIDNAEPVLTVNSSNAPDKISEAQFGLLSSVGPDNKFTLWHNRMGHLSARILRSTKSTVEGMKFVSTEINKHYSKLCDGCAFGKMTMAPVPRRPPAIHSASKQAVSSSRALQPGQLIVADLIFSPVPAIKSEATCSLVLTDVASRYMWVYHMKSKDQTFVMMKKFISWMKSRNLSVKTVTTIRTDNGTEFKSKEFVKLLESENIILEHCPPYMHVYMAERANRTVQDTARAMLHTHGVATSFWAEAVSYAVYVLNRSVTKNHRTQTRYERFFGTVPDVSKIRTFGSLVYARLYNQTLKKWDPLAFKGRFLGIDEASPTAWRIYKFSTGTIIHSSSVVFDESPSSKVGKSAFELEAESKKLRDLFRVDSLIEPCPAESEPMIPNSEPLGSPTVESPKRTKLGQRDRKVLDPNHILPLNSKRVRRPPQSQVEIVKERCLSAEELRSTPTSYRQAMQFPEWAESIASEVMSLASNKTFTIMKRPPGAAVIGIKWLFRVKEDKDGNVARYKTRCVALGNLQKYHSNFDFLETFAPVVRYSTLRMLFAVAAKRDLHLHHCDVDTAFLYGTMPASDPTYVKIPDGYPIPPELQGESDLVARCDKAIYGLKQAPRLWNQNIDSNMKNMGFSQSPYDSCLYYRHLNGEQLFVTIFVDDIVIAGSSVSQIAEFKSELRQRYRIKDLGELSWCLGMSITRDWNKGTITIDQSKYAGDVLKRFGMSDCKPVQVPMTPGLQLLHPESCGYDDGDAETDEPSLKRARSKTYPYREVVGSLMYLMVSTRPDLAYSVSYLSRYMNAYDTSHVAAAQYILRYIHSSASLGITYHRDKSLAVVGYSDADWASDINSRRSTTGYIFFMSGGPVSWKSKLQPTVALSTSEAEYMALSFSAQEALALKRLCTSFRIDDLPVMLYEDNSGAIAMAHNPVHYAKTKHIHIRFHFVRECVENKEIDVTYVPTADMLADPLTKALSKDIFLCHRRAIMG